MKRTDIQTIGQAIQEFLKEHKTLNDKLLETRITHAWQEVLGPMIMRYTQNVYVQNKVLYVSLSSSVLRNELSLSRERLVQSLNERAGAEVIRDIVFR
ncbi:Zn-ribbon-containing protein [Bacteroidales bacterium Barb6]|nr:Zn-ribbon-containing protein [Bacteroidales bacterium Barb6]OAV73167.1 Zn-ribbon-containing protein [Bacteroidales bacterium Barb6]